MLGRKSERFADCPIIEASVGKLLVASDSTKPTDGSGLLSGELPARGGRWSEQLLKSAPVPDFPRSQKPGTGDDLSTTESLPGAGKANEVQISSRPRFSVDFPAPLLAHSREVKGVTNL